MRRCFREFPGTESRGCAVNTVGTWPGMLGRDVKYLRRTDEEETRESDIRKHSLLNNAMLLFLNS